MVSGRRGLDTRANGTGADLFGGAAEQGNAHINEP